MIRIHRGTEPAALREARRRRLPELRRIAAVSDPRSDEITGYDVAAEPLWTAQHRKCCYCERKIELAYYDVEHYRPKAEADRQPGCSETHGYWWLAFTWKNLLFSCPACNRSGKRAKFPLDLGSSALLPGRPPPGQEIALLLDPAAEDPITEICFVRAVNPAAPPSAALHWIARPRNGSLRGATSIEVLGLNRRGIVDLRDDHVARWVRPQADHLKAALAARDAGRIADEHARASALFEPGSMFAALSYDALCYFVPPPLLSPWGLEWPAPGSVALPPPPRRPPSRANAPRRAATRR